MQSYCGSVKGEIKVLLVLMQRPELRKTSIFLQETMVTRLPATMQSQQFTVVKWSIRN